jgi:hypothetical protein
MSRPLLTSMVQPFRSPEMARAFADFYQHDEVQGEGAVLLTVVRYAEGQKRVVERSLHATREAANDCLDAVTAFYDRENRA